MLPVLGGCSNTNCKLNHDHIALDQNQTNLAKMCLVKGERKMAAQL